MGPQRVDIDPCGFRAFKARMVIGDCENECHTYRSSVLSFRAGRSVAGAADEHPGAAAALRRRLPASAFPCRRCRLGGASRAAARFLTDIGAAAGKARLGGSRERWRWCRLARRRRRRPAAGGQVGGRAGLPAPRGDAARAARSRGRRQRCCRRCRRRRCGDIGDRSWARHAGSRRRSGRRAAAARAAGGRVGAAGGEGRYRCGHGAAAGSLARGGSITSDSGGG